jgi:hypothetical protein
MAGNAVGGSLFASLLIAEGGRATWAGLGALVAASLAASAVIRRRVTAVTLSWVAGLALAVPVLLASPQQCNVAGVSAIVVVLTVFALAALIVWVPALPQLLASSFGVAGLAVFLVGAQPECHPQVQSALVAACAVPVVFVIVRVSVRLSELRAEQQIRMEVSRALEESAAQAERDAALQLQDSVTEATKLMKNIAAIGVATPADRRELRRLDGLIRASIQVDPKTAGGFASAALQVAQLAADNGKSVRVLTIKDSGDPRPLPGPVVRAAEALVLGSPEGAATVQALSAPGEDSLLISAPLVALSEAGLHPGWAVAIDDCRAELEVEPATATAVLIALRAVSISAH